MADGHFLRHLRQMKDLYTVRRQLALAHVKEFMPDSLAAGLGLIAQLPGLANDRAIVELARVEGLAPSALSAWYLDRTHAKNGLLLSVTNLHSDNINAACEKLANIVAAH